MSLSSKKLDILTQLKVSASLGDGLLTDAGHVNSLRNGGGIKSLNSKNKDVVEYIIDLMSLIFGADFLEKSVKKTMKKVFKRDSGGKMELEERLKAALLDALCGEDGDHPIPEDFLTSGYALPVKAMDLFDLFKLNPGQASNSRILGGPTGFEATFLSRVLQQTSAQATSFTSLPQMLFGYTLLGNAVTITGDIDGIPSTYDGLSTSGLPTVSIEDFFRSILYAPGFKLLDSTAIALDVLDAVLGFMSANRTNRSLANEEVLKEIVTKFGNEEPVETVFTFNAKSLEDIAHRAKKRKAGGYNLDLGCNLVNVKITEDAILTQIDNQPDYAGMFTSALETQLAADGTTLTAPIKQNFQRGLVKALLLVLLKHTLLSPRVWTLFVLSKIFHVGYPNSKYATQASSAINELADIQEILSDRKEIVKKLTEKVTNLLIEYLGDLLIKEIMKAVIKLKERQTKEQLESYTKIMSSFAKVEAVLAQADSAVTQVRNV